MMYEKLEYILISWWSSHKIGFVAIILVLSLLACSLMPRAPERSRPTPSQGVTVELLEVPEDACLGDIVTLTLRTMPGNKCDASFSFRIEDHWNVENVEEVADSEGICSLEWKTPNNASPGNAQIYIDVHFEDIESRSLAPETFHMDRCEK
jgi:hypothetical protein